VGLNLSDNNNNPIDYDRLAVAGRTGAATRIRTRPPNATPPGAFADLVRKIRATDGRCEYLLPSGTEFDYDKVNLTASSGGAHFPRVKSSQACEENPQGWYYDPPLPAQPTRMIACGGACKTLHGATGEATANATIQLDCPTEFDAGP
jgi:hypothetical protein